MVHTLQIVHVINSSWVGVYLDGHKISDGYFNVAELADAEKALATYGGLLGLTVRRVVKDPDWWAELGGVLPDRIAWYTGEAMSRPTTLPTVNYYGDERPES